MTGLTVGNTVQYVTETNVYAALILEVHDTESGRVDLLVFCVASERPIARRETSRVYSEQELPGTWHWLPAVD